MTTQSNIGAAENTAISGKEIGSTEMINIGECLSVQRQKKDLTIEQISKILKITKSQVTALESNDFGFFRSTTFARGYLKNYSKYLGLDTSIILNVFDSTLAHEKEPAIQFVDKGNKQTHFGDPIVIFISVVIVAILAFFVFWWPDSAGVVERISDDVKKSAEERVFDSDQAGLTSNKTAENMSDSLSAEEQGVTERIASTLVNPSVDTLADSAKQSLLEKSPLESKQSETQMTPSLENESVEVVTGLSAETKAILADAGVNPEEVERTTQEVLEGKQEVETQSAVVSSDAPVADIDMIYVRDCWTEIRDASGKILFSGVKTAGSSLQLTGEAPYRVVLGYAKGVSSLKYKGELVDISPYIRKDLARFELK